MPNVRWGHGKTGYRSVAPNQNPRDFVTSIKIVPSLCSSKLTDGGVSHIKIVKKGVERSKRGKGEGLKK
jgi:hypothetical protein